MKSSSRRIFYPTWSDCIIPSFVLEISAKDLHTLHYYAGGLGDILKNYSIKQTFLLS